jgi:hypothetical protein
MTVRAIRGVGFVLFVLGLSGTVLAGDFIPSLVRDYKRRNCWPEPFLTSDIAAVRAPFATMVSNGWRRQNMLGDNYFDSANGNLNEAGTLKLRWILTESPAQHRIVYVHVAGTEEETSLRIASIQKEMNRIAPQGTIVPILPTTIPDEGWDASRVEQITRAYQKSMPTPQLPAASAIGSSSGSSGSGN